MRAQHTSLREIIEGGNQFVVPLFQRTYSWDQKEWHQLWEDLMELYEQEIPRKHFMGSLVTMPSDPTPETVTRYTLIDGQQRLTTFFVLLALLRDRCRIADPKLGDEILNTFLVNPYKEKENYYKLFPTQTDRQAYFDMIHTNKPGNADGDLQLWKAYRYFDRLLKQNVTLNLKKLMEVIVTRLILVSIVLDADDNPHIIFESLNAKGRPLTQADLIRNYFFMKISMDRQQEIYTNYWKPMQDELDDNLTEFIRHFLMSEGGWVNKSEIYYTLVQKIQASNENIVEYLKKLLRFSTYYVKLLNPEKEQAAPICRRLKRLNRIEVTTAYPFLLNIYNDYVNLKIDESQFEGILKIIENFLIRRIVCRIPTNKLNKIFPPLYRQISSGILSDTLENLKMILADKEYPVDSQFSERFASANLYQRNTDNTKLILETLEESFEHHERIDFSNLTIEHIMPQTLTDWWKSSLGENFETDHEMLLHTIGNLTLTGYNIDMKNYDYPSKKEILVKSHLELNDYFLKLDKWTESEIGTRAQNLANKALEIWPYFGPEKRNLDSYKSAIKDMTTPKKLIFMDKEYAVLTWRDLEQKLLEAIFDYDRDLFDQIAAQYPHHVNRSKTEFRTSRQLANGFWIETNLSGKNIREFCLNATQLVGLSQEDWHTE